MSENIKKFFNPAFILQLVVLLGGMLIAYGKLSADVANNEKNRAQDLEYFKESVADIKADLKEIQRDIKVILINNKNFK